MEISVVAGNITQQESPAIVVGMLQGVTDPAGALGEVDQALDGAITSLIEDGEIKGNRGELTLLHTLGKLPSKRVVVAGLGYSDSVSINTVRALAASGSGGRAGLGGRGRAAAGRRRHRGGERLVRAGGRR